MLYRSSSFSLSVEFCFSGINYLIGIKYYFIQNKINEEKKNKQIGYSFIMTYIHVVLNHLRAIIRYINIPDLYFVSNHYVLEFESFTCICWCASFISSVCRMASTTSFTLFSSVYAVLFFHGNLASIGMVCWS